MEKRFGKGQRSSGPSPAILERIHPAPQFVDAGHALFLEHPGDDESAVGA